MVFGKTSGGKGNLRISSSLQDLTSYRHLDPQYSIPTLNSINQHHQQQQQQQLLQNSTFSKTKPTQTLTPTRKKWARPVTLSICFFILLILIIYAISSLYSYHHASGKYYVVLDCGSTGTRVFVYKAEVLVQVQQTKHSSFPISVTSLRNGLQKKRNSQSGRAYDRMETEPGLDKLVHNVTGLKAALKPLLKWAMKQIPEGAHKSTSLFLYATAGVRRLPNEDSKWLLENAWSVLKGSSFVCRKEWVKIITGTEEAYFGWIALNYDNGVLGVKPRKATYGALDLGGSSLQVTFESDQSLNSETSLYVKIGSVNHHLTAYSLAGYGLNEAFDKSVAYVFKKDKVGLGGTVKHPCLQSGYKNQYTCSRCLSGEREREGESPKVNGSESVVGGGKGEVKTSVTLVGAPNWQECSAIGKVAVNLSEWSDVGQGLDCEISPCALRENLPRPLGHFYVISGFFVVYRFFNLSSEATIDDVLEKGREFCGKKWDVAKKSVAPQPFIEQYCFRAPYVASLLREGLHITDRHITVGSGGITWTLGVALLEAGKSYSTRFGLRGFDLVQMKTNPLILIPILLLSLILLCCALSCVLKWVPRFFRRQYLPLFRHSNGSSTSVLNIPSPLWFKSWSPIISGESRIKTPLSPTIAGSQDRPFGLGPGLGDNSGGIQMMESSFYPAASSVSHSYSSSNLGQMPFDSSNIGTFWSPHRSQMRLQSRRSQSREDLNSSVADPHTVKV
ncbi:probable apyrase 7 [Vicia villosa]|uniref:probable apyrase 7 n=1 Tax=Vicia villosa TaxID=3911 RepID=UPI00273B1E80|nr:probable apyrase 7 [Vicia villosa]XP_058767799.1 probable apyrase 7 [Vicia villosa]